MSLPIFFIISAIIFLTPIILYRNLLDKKKRELKFLKEKEKYNELKINALLEIKNQIDYTLDLEKIFESVLLSFNDAFPYSAISALSIKNQLGIFKTQTKDVVSNEFVQHIKDCMKKVLFDDANIPPLSNDLIEEKIDGVPLDDRVDSHLGSFFSAPIIINHQHAGIIAISSTKEQAFTENQLDLIRSVCEFLSSVLTKFAIGLEVEKNKTKTMIENFTDGIFIVDTASNVNYINKAARDFLKLDKQNLKITDILSGLPNTYDFKDKILGVINRNQIFEEKDVQIDEKTFIIKIRPVHETENQKVIGAEILLQDITLEKTIARMKDDFTNVMVHELRSPLTAIKASSELLISPADLTDDERKRMMRLIYDASDKMIYEVSKILDAAKLDSGLFNIKKMPSDLTKIITDRVNIFQASADEKGIKIQTELDPNITTFSFDGVQVTQVINNLLSNSLKFTPLGGTITVKTQKTPSDITVSVSDTGVGIPKEKQHLLFTKYSQVEGGGGKMGTGLGLYVVKGVVERHGGRIHLESNPGEGTTISFTLPFEHSETPMESSTPGIVLRPHSMNN